MKYLSTIRLPLLIALVAVLILGFANETAAQTTTYTYTGNLSQAGSPANGSFNMTFTLYPAVSGGAPVGVPINRSVTVTNGTFSVPLDFGAAAFSGADRYLEVTVSGTAIVPRAQITSTPYAVRALTVTGPVTGSNAVATLSVSNSAPGILDPSPANLPPSAVRGEATSTTDSTVGVLGISNGTDGAGIIGLGPAGVFGLSTQSAGEGVTGQADGAGATGVRGESSAGVALQANTSTGRLIVGYKDGGSAFEIDASGHLTLKDGISLYNGRFNLLFNGAMNAANNQFTVDGSGNLSAQLVSVQLGTGGSANVCVAAGSPQLRSCSSSLRYKRNIGAFSEGLETLKRLNPITFEWKENGMKDVGLGAEDVAAVEPLLTFNNVKGEVEGVKYAQINLVLINAIKEQQQQIEKQQAVIDRDHAHIEALTKMVCATRRRSPVCRQTNRRP